MNLANMLSFDLTILSQLNSSLSFFSLQSTFTCLKQLHANKQIDQHDAEVARLSRKVRNLNDRGLAWRSRYRPSPGQAIDGPMSIVCFSRLNAIVKVSASQKTVLVEPGVEYIALAKELKEHGMNLASDTKKGVSQPGMTIGEALHEPEGFSDSINWAETIQNNGDIVIQRPSPARSRAMNNMESTPAYTLLELHLAEGESRDE